MKQIDIRLLERFSGLKAHTIRAWELRYSLFHPDRTSANRRVYNLDDSKLLLNLSLLSKHGYPVSKLARLSSEQVEVEIARLDLTVAAAEVNVTLLLFSFIGGDIDAFERTFNNFVDRTDYHFAITRLLIPFIDRAEIFSYHDRGSNMHFIVTAIRKRILHATHSIRSKAKFDDPILLFLPEDEHFDLILLILSYFLQYEGYRVLYLGTNISTENIVEVVDQYHPRLIITYLSSPNKQLIALSKLLDTKQEILICTAKKGLKNFQYDSINYKEVTTLVRPFYE